MAGTNELTEFVRDALTRGMSRTEVEGVLLRAGWSRDMVQTALAGYAEVDSPIPVPRPRAYLSAREAFLYLLLFGTLYISAYNAGALLFEAIDRAIPDAAVHTYASYTREAVRWALSSLVVSFPVFLYLSAITNRSVQRDPAKRRSNVRRWLMYLTIFVAASVLVGDLITLVYNALGGELTTRFVLKVMTIAAIAGTVFGFYLADLRLDDTQSPGDGGFARRLFAGFGSVSVAAVVSSGFFMVGPPAEERVRRLDEQRVSHVRDIMHAENVYFERQGRLASSLDDLSREVAIVIDTKTGPYEYRVTGPAAYELCATFQLDSRQTDDSLHDIFWSHPAGRSCFRLKAKEYR